VLEWLSWGDRRHPSRRSIGTVYCKFQCDLKSIVSVIWRHTAEHRHIFPQMDRTAVSLPRAQSLILGTHYRESRLNVNPENLMVNSE